MKDLSKNLRSIFETIENYSLDTDLKIILRDSESFTELNTIEELDEIDSDPEIDANLYFDKLNSILTLLLTQIDVNKGELDIARTTLDKYAYEPSDLISENEQAIVSLIFKDLNTITSLKEFSRVLNRWNRTLLIYHTLLKSESPDDIKLVEIQNGSIDVLFNIDFDIAIDLTELIKVGLKVYGAYLLYRSKTAKAIIESYLGNRKLIQSEKDRERLMLDNIKESIAAKILEQHKERVKDDKKIEKTGVEKKIDEVSTVITDHIIKGNEVKLLTAPIRGNDETETLISSNSDDLNEETAIVRNIFRKNEKLLANKLGLFVKKCKTAIIIQMVKLSDTTTFA